MLSEARRAAPEEACGLLLGKGRTIREARPAINLAADPLTGFEIDPAALFEACRNARTGAPGVLGYYHSHPNGHGEPSMRDAARAAPDDMLWLIVANDRVAAFRAGEAGIHGRFQPIDLREE